MSQTDGYVENTAIQEINPAIEERNPSIEERNPSIQSEKLSIEKIKKGFFAGASAIFPEYIRAFRKV